MIRNLNISQRILITTTASFSLGALLLVVYVYLSLPAGIGNLLIDEQQAKAEQIAQQIQTELQQRLRMLQRLAPHLLSGNELHDKHQLKTLLSKLMIDTDVFNGGIAIFNIDGIGIGEYPSSSGRIELDISDRDHVLEVRRTLQPVITQPLVSRSLGQPSFFINVPIINKNSELVGFLIGVTVLHADNFLIDVAGGHLPHSRKVYIIDPANKLIVTSSNLELAMQPLPPAGQIPVIDRLSTGSTSGTTGGEDSIEVLFASAAIPHMGWIVIQAVPKQLVYAPVKRLVLQISIFSGTIIIFALLFFGTLITRMLRPLGQAVTTIDQMVADPSIFKPLPVNRQDEVGRLVQAFNRLFNLREEQRQRLYLATSGVGIGIWEYRTASSQVFFDEQMCQLYHLSPTTPDKALELWLERLHPDDRPRIEERIAAAIADTADYDVEFRAVLPNGNVRWIKANAIVIRDREGIAQRMIGTNYDISAQKRAEMLKNQFVSTVSHELRTPLTSISGALGLLAGGAAGTLSEQGQHLIDIAHKNAQKLGVLINDLLDMEKISAGKMRFDISQQPLLPIVEQAINTNMPYAQQHGVVYKLISCDGQLLVRVDAHRLTQVLTNLLSNAAKFSPSDTEVDVVVMTHEGRARVEVRDQGPGIPLEMQSQLFTNFFQIDSSDTREQGGTGLGLAISRKLIEHMDGKIGFYSEPGQGSTFFVELPAEH